MTSNMTWTVVTFGAGVIAGIIAHDTWGSHPSIHPSVVAQASAPSSAPGELDHRCDMDWNRLRSEMGKAIQDERVEQALEEARATAAKSAAASTGSSDALGTPGSDARDDEAAHALMEQSQVLDRAVRAGHWTDRDAEQLHEIFPRLAPEDRTKALASLSKAINEGKMSVDTITIF